MGATMSDQIANLGSQDFLGFVSIVGAFSSGLILGTLALLYAFFQKAQDTRRAQSLDALKQDMLARGMSPDDIVIVTVLAAGIPDKKGQMLRPVGVR
jgi:hypothetical protein